MPIADNFEGSYLTFKSINGLVFAIDLLVAGKVFSVIEICTTLNFIQDFLQSGWIRYDVPTVPR